MKPVHKFSFSFDPQKLQADLDFVQKEWTAHFNTAYYCGEWSGIALRSPIVKNHSLFPGDPGNTEFEDDPILNRIPYTHAVINNFLTSKLSVRYLRLTPGSEIKPHRDFDMVFWDGFVRLHIPVLTNDEVVFTVAGECLKMKPGDCWFADFSQIHSVKNHGTTDRVHIVVDCKVSPWLVALFEKEGILQKGEQKPDPMDQYSRESKKQIIQALLHMNTETSVSTAGQIALKYGLLLSDI